MTGTTAIWLLLKAGLYLTELIFPTAFIALMMGLSAFAVALLSGVLGKLWLQVVAWVAISFVLLLVSRRFAPKPGRRTKIKDAVTAETITEILPGKPGRVLYEGNSWPRH